MKEIHKIFINYGNVLSEQINQYLFKFELASKYIVYDYDF